MLRYFLRCKHSADAVDDSTIVSYTIRNTEQNQPSLMFEVLSGDYRDLRSTFRVDLPGYVIGYRGCSHNPTKICYVKHNNVSSLQMKIVT